MRSRTAAALALLLAAGCGAETPPPPPTPAPAPAKPEPEPPPAPPPTPTGRALLVATEYGLSPIACFLSQTRQFAAGEPCHALAPVGTDIWLMSGQTAKVTGRGEATCPGATAEPTLQIDAPRDVLRGDALLPADARELLTYVPPTLPPDVDRAASKQLRDRVAAALVAAFPTLGKNIKPRVEQRAALDLDGDGATEELIAASVPGRDDESPLRVSALLHGPEGGPLAPLRGRTDTREHYTVIGALDLDGDGQRELYLNTYADDGFSLSVERRTAEGLVSEGRWSCGP